MISILIPVIRPMKAERAAHLARVNAGISEEDFEILMEEDKERIGCPKMLKKLVEKSKGDIVVFIGDDSLPVKDWLKYALEDMARLPDGWGLVGFNDKTGRQLATHWMADKRLLPELDGEFFHTGYSHCCCDVELQRRCMELGRFVYSEKAEVLHDHPLIGGSGEWDDDYLRVYSAPVRNKDRELLQNRLRNGWKTID